MASKRIYNLTPTTDTQGKGMIADMSGDVEAVFTPTTYHTVTTLPVSPLPSVLYHLSATDGFAPKGVYTYTNGWGCIEQLEEMVLTWSADVDIILYTGVSYIVNVSAGVTLLKINMTSDGACRFVINNTDEYDVVNPSGDIIYKTGEDGLSVIGRDSVRLIVQRDTVGVDIEYEYSTLDRIKIPIPFITTWSIPANNTTVTIPAVTGFTYDGVIDYGDGSGELTFNSWDDVNFNHTYTVAGDYQIKISGIFESINCVSKTEADYILSIDNLGEVGWKYLYRAFYDCDNLEYCYGGDLSQATNLDSMFKYCGILHTVDCSSWDVSNVTNIGSIFQYCSSLTTLDVSNWDLSNVEYMWNMFTYCENLIELDVSNFNFPLVQYLDSMFDGCVSLTTIDVSNWDVSNVESFGRLFADCTSLTTIDVSNWNMSSATDIYDIFRACKSLTILDVSSWDVSNVVYMDGVFYLSEWWDDPDATSLTTLDVSNWNTSSAVTISGMFGGCDQLVTIDVSGFNTNAVEAMGEIFNGCSSLTSIDVSNFNMTKVMDMKGMFAECSSLSEINVSSWAFATILPDTYSRMEMSEMFENCSSLTTLDVGNWNVDLVTGYKEMFQGCSGLTTLDVSNWVMNTTSYYKTEYLLGMFQSCSSLVNIDVSGWDMSTIEVVTRMFNGCTSMTNTIDANQFWWNSSIGDGSYYHGNTFTNDTNISNYSSIPNDWKGL